MNSYAGSDITLLLHAWNDGNDQALHELTPLVYRELHRAARAFMAREHAGHLLDSTALVNEVYLRLLRLKHTGWQNRSHFFASCAQLMRRVLTDYARSRLYLKRGGGVQVLPLNEETMSLSHPAEILALDQALHDLAEVDPRKSKVIELRVFGGLSVKETAEVLNISEDTVNRDGKFARCWLLRALDLRNPNRSRSDA
jgi:RNA polymerase sigma factor (TIGR02999 family)